MKLVQILGNDPAKTGTASSNGHLGLNVLTVGNGTPTTVKTRNIGPHTFTVVQVMSQQKLENLISIANAHCTLNREVKVHELARIYHERAFLLQGTVDTDLDALEARWQKKEAERIKSHTDQLSKYGPTAPDRKTHAEAIATKEAEFNRLVAKLDILCEPTKAALEQALYEKEDFDSQLHALLMNERRKAVTPPAAVTQTNETKNSSGPEKKGLPWLEVAFGIGSGLLMATGLGGLTGWFEPADLFQHIWPPQILVLVGFGQTAVFSLGHLVHSTARDIYRSGSKRLNGTGIALAGAWIASSVLDAWGLYSAVSRSRSPLEGPGAPFVAYLGLNLFLSGIYFGLKQNRAREETRLDVSSVPHPEPTEEARIARYDALTARIEALNVKRNAALALLEENTELQEASALCPEIEALHEEMVRFDSEIEAHKSALEKLTQESRLDEDEIDHVKAKIEELKSTCDQMYSCLNGVAPSATA